MELEGPVDDGPKATCLDPGVHLFKHHARADKYSLHSDGFHKDRYRVELAGRIQRTDESDMPADTHGLDRSLQGACPADLDHVIDAPAAGEFEDYFVPIFVIAIIDRLIRTQLANLAKLFVAAR